MFHCIINYMNTAPDGSIVICDHYHISARTEQDIRNMEQAISELLDHLGINHTSRFIFEPEGAEK